jgi:hypothetical protein
VRAPPGRPLWAVLLPLLAAAPLAAQQPRILTGVQPAEVTVGDVFRSAVRVELPAGATVVFGELELSEPLEQVDTARLLPGEGATTAVFDLVVWRVGEAEPPRVVVRVVGPGEEDRRAEVALRLPVVRSVLPEGEVQPQPPRAILPGRRSGVLWLALLAFLVALAGAAAAWRHARGDRGEAQEADARAAALHELRMLEESGLLDAGEWDAFYVSLTAILRRVLAERSPRLGRALTTPELVARLEEDEPAARDRLAALLAGADRVKFGRQASRREQALADLEAVRRWVGGGRGEG